MKQYLYVVEDKVAQQVMPPFASPNDNVAKRDFISGAYGAQKPIQDLNLWRIGEFNSSLVDENVTFSLREDKLLINPTSFEVSDYIAELESMKKAFNLATTDNE